MKKKAFLISGFLALTAAVLFLCLFPSYYEIEWRDSFPVNIALSYLENIRTEELWVLGRPIILDQELMAQTINKEGITQNKIIRIEQLKQSMRLSVEETAAVYEYPFYNQEKTMGIEQLSSLFWEESTQESFRMKALLFNAEPGTDVSVSAESDVWLKVRYKQFILTRTMIVVVRGIKAGGTIRIID